MEGSPFIEGKPNYLTSPMVTAGDRVYMVGHQDGSFPDLGWHIKGEMGGIWDHPIKLMDGFDIGLSIQGRPFHLDHAEQFVNYPYANKHLYTWQEESLTIERWQFVPDGKEGLVIEVIIQNRDAAKEVDISFTGFTDLRPTWLGERTAMIDGPDQAYWNADSSAWMVKDSLNSWFNLFGSDITPVSHNENKPYPKQGMGSSNTISYQLDLKPGLNTLHFFIAGSYQSEKAALENYASIKGKYLTDLQQKRLRYEGLSSKTKLTIPDKRLEQAFEWLKYNCDWLIRTVPEIGTGITAGLPDYPWWFGVDSEYALQGYMAIGQSEVVYKTIHLLDSVSEALNENGRIIHEMSTNGAVFNRGNSNETPQFASLIWKIYQWNGDKTFLERYLPTIEKGLDWLMKENDADGNLFPDGFGMMEIHGMDSEMIDVAAYTQKAFVDASKIEIALGHTEKAEAYASLAARLKEKINNEFWSEEFASYADFRGTDQQALHLLEDAILRADTLNKPWAVKELQQTKNAILKNRSNGTRPFVLHHNWVVNTPMETEIAPSEKALKALTTAEKFVNPFGVFVTGIDRDASAGSDEGSFQGSKIFSYTGAVMTLPTGVQAIAENNYGRPDQALNYLERMTRTFSYAFPGSIYEVSPDYGMMTQAWNIYSYAIPIVEQFFGIHPAAAERKVVISPQMPTSWTNASLENVQVGENEISVFYERTDKKLNIKVMQIKPDWELECVIPKSKITSYKVLQGNQEVEETSSDYRFFSNANMIEIELTYE
jgi:glycogen debranching enzyme